MIVEPKSRDKLDAMVNGSEDGITDWLSINWRQAEENVRRLR
jgi:RNA-directed DNA polymerase